MEALIAATGATVTVIAAIVTAFLTFRTTRADVSVAVINAYKQRVEQVENEMKEYREKTVSEMMVLTKQIAELTGVVKAKDERIKSLETILQNRNPEMENYMKSTTDVLGEILKFMQQVGQKMTANITSLTNG